MKKSGQEEILMNNKCTITYIHDPAHHMRKLGLLNIFFVVEVRSSSDLLLLDWSPFEKHNDYGDIVSRAFVERVLGK